MGKEYISELKSWSVYFLTAMAGIWIHEIGHCIPAWLNGIPAFPSPANEYILHPVSTELNQCISLGGYVGTLLFIIIALLVFLLTNFRYKTEIYAGATAIIGMYCILILFNGRGHGGHEFQEAQAAMGYTYSGHSMDVIVVVLLIFLASIWFLYKKPKINIIWRLLTGAIITFFFFIFYEWINNLIFDPFFKSQAILRN
jgi:hypothetical protein